jgi:hypothetical protein
MDNERFNPLLSRKSTIGLRINAMSRQKIRVTKMFVNSVANSDIIISGMSNIKNLLNPESGLYILEGIFII